MVLCVFNQDEVTSEGGRAGVDRVGLTGYKRFFVFPDHLESVKVRELNSSAALLTRGRVFGLPGIFRPAPL